MSTSSILVVGGTAGTSVGTSFANAARRMGMEAGIIDSSQAYDAPALQRWVNWHWRGKRPSRLGAFSERVVRACHEGRPDVLLCTGLAPVRASALREIGLLGIRRINFLTDDPWNRSLQAPWFVDAVPEYDAIYSPRRANMHELNAAGCARVHFLPFGYDADLFHPPAAAELTSLEGRPADVVFAGGADADRIPYMTALRDAGIRVALYGGYWQRSARTRELARGYADPPTLRAAVASAKVSLCLVRRANRDGNCMRTFEVPAIGGCMLAEDTSDHRDLFGADGEAVLYFNNVDEMIRKCLRLCEDGDLRTRLARAAHRIVTSGRHTYDDRLRSMLQEGAIA